MGKVKEFFHDAGDSIKGVVKELKPEINHICRRVRHWRDDEALDLLKELVAYLLEKESVREQAAEYLASIKLPMKVKSDVEH